MATGRGVETRGHILGFQEEIEHVAQESEEAFFTWFNSAKDANAAFIQGEWDFASHIAKPLTSYLTDSSCHTVMEIGHGGGRLLAAASRYFARAVGVDIHGHNQLVLTKLAERGIHNVELHRSDGRSLPLPDSSVNVAYSFIVFQHLETLQILERYLEETCRVLVPGGMAVIYFGRKCPLSLRRSSPWLYYGDLVLENLLLRKGYQEIPARVNETNLRLTLRFARKLSRRAGFQVLGQLVSRKLGTGRRNLPYGGQHGLLLRKRG